MTNKPKTLQQQDEELLHDVLGDASDALTRVDPLASMNGTLPSWMTNNLLDESSTRPTTEKDVGLP